MRSLVPILVLVIALLVLWIALLDRNFPPPTVSVPTVEQVQALAQLMTLRVPVADMQVVRLQGYTGGASLILVSRGQVLIGTDLDQAHFEEVDQSARHAVLVLPEPSVQYAALDHERTTIYRIDRSGLWQFMPGDAGETALVNRAMRQAQVQLAAVLEDHPEYREQARQQAQQVIGRFFEAVGWEVEVRAGAHSVDITPVRAPRRFADTVTSPRGVSEPSSPAATPLAGHSATDGLRTRLGSRWTRILSPALSPPQCPSAV